MENYSFNEKIILNTDNDKILEIITVNYIITYFG